MSTRLARSHALGAVAGISVFSSGLAGMLIAGAHPARLQAASRCSAPAAAAALAPRNSAQRLSPQVKAATPITTGAHMPTTPSPTPSASTAKPSPTGTATPSPTLTATPSPTPTGTSSPTPSPSPTPSVTSSSSPAPSPSPTQQPARLCLTIASTSTTSQLQPGGQASFLITVWFSNTATSHPGHPESAALGDVATVSLSASPTSMSPQFVACHLHGQESCRRISRTRYAVSGMVPGEAAQLSARIALPANAGNVNVTLSASATSPDAAHPTSASATVQVRQPSPSPSPTNSPSPTPTPTGVGNTLSPVGSGPYPTSVPTLPTPADVGSAFPTLSPGASPVTLPPQRHLRLANASATVPLDMRLIGGQVAGLALLAAAVTIAVARLSLRKPQASRPEPPESADPPQSP